MTIDWERIWVLSDEWRPDALRARPVDLAAEPRDLLLGTVEAPLTRFVHASGSTPYDLVPCTFVELMLVSQKLCDVLTDKRVSGWRTYAVELAGKHGEPIADFHGLAVTGRCGPIDRARSQQVIKPPKKPGGMGKRWLRGLFFAPDSWDGSDIFVPEGTAWVLVVDRVKAAIDHAGLTNVAFDPVTEIELLAAGKHWVLR